MVSERCPRCIVDGAAIVERVVVGDVAAGVLYDGSCCVGELTIVLKICRPSVGDSVHRVVDEHAGIDERTAEDFERGGVVERTAVRDFVANPPPR